VGGVVEESVTVDVGGAVDVVSNVAAVAAFVGLAEAAAGGGTVDAVFAVCPDVAVAGDVRDSFAAGAAAATVVVKAAVDVTGGVRVAVGGAGTTSGAGSVIARF
jgi:hypothetical protein